MGPPALLPLRRKVISLQTILVEKYLSSLTSHLHSQIYFVISPQTLEVTDIFISSVQSLVLAELFRNHSLL
jgi:hypothetical protein